MTQEESRREPRIVTKEEYLRILDEAIIRAKQTDRDREAAERRKLS